MLLGRPNKWVGVMNAPEAALDARWFIQQLPTISAACRACLAAATPRSAAAWRPFWTSWASEFETAGRRAAWVVCGRGKR